MFDVVYDRPGGSTTYNAVPCKSLKEAQDLVRTFRNKYLGKKYPNSKGFYPFNNVRIITL